MTGLKITAKTVNMIRCIPLNSQSMTKNCFYDAWFTYTLKISEYFGKTNIPVLVMCDNSLNPNLVKYILTVNSKTKKVLCKKEEICEFSHWSIYNIEVNIVLSLTKLLKAAANKKQDQNKHNITIKSINDYNEPISISVTDVHAIISLVVVFKCYPIEWRKLFLWIAWLAVTIQLSLTNSDGEISHVYG